MYRLLQRLKKLALLSLKMYHNATCNSQKVWTELAHPWKPPQNPSWKGLPARFPPFYGICFVTPPHLIGASLPCQDDDVRQEAVAAAALPRQILHNRICEWGGGVTCLRGCPFHPGSNDCKSWSGGVSPRCPAWPWCHLDVLKLADTIARYKNRNLKPKNRIGRLKNRNSNEPTQSADTKIGT